ncbi:GNAT family N-acetyltransferase [Pseudonocardia kongjuensis]|uniref:GNAT family N-acetyltransferase n=1 Tax=Pseudonocardia kongjuensis TaxID=102227 RepID=A0ABP4IFY9_9PSEU
MRRAEPMDAGAIARVHVRSWQAGYRGQLPDELLDSLNATDRVARWEAEIEAAEWPGRGTLLIEDHDARVAGFAHFVPSRDGDDGPDSTGEIASFYIDPASWGQGLGSRLMHSALAELGSAYRTGTLWVLETNIRAQAFYEATGWARDGQGKDDLMAGVTIRALRYRHELRALFRDRRAPLPLLSADTYATHLRDLTSDTALDVRRSTDPTRRHR